MDLEYPHGRGKGNAMLMIGFVFVRVEYRAGKGFKRCFWKMSEALDMPSPLRRQGGTLRNSRAST